MHESSSQPSSRKSGNFVDAAAGDLRSVQEQSMQALCRKILKSRIFRGFYIERRYVENLHSYRDIVALEKNERELQRLLLDIRQRVLQFYWHDAPPHKWFGVSAGKIVDATVPQGATDVHIWTELNELAYGQYWFSIKTIRFRENEVLLKLKMVRPVELEASHDTILRRSLGARLSITPVKQSVASDDDNSQKQVQDTGSCKDDLTIEEPPEPEIGIKDFVQLILSWGNSIKHTLYDFMHNEITKENLLECLRLIGLVFISLLSGSVLLLRYLGVFSLRFMYEISRLTHVLSPIVIKIIDVLNKTIGGFYILLTMVWKDVFYHRDKVRKPIMQLEPTTRVYQSIEYNVHQSSPTRQTRRHITHASATTAQYGNFERKFPM